MVSELSAPDSERLSIRLNPKNYMLWEFQFRVRVEGKGLARVLDGTDPRPDSTATAEHITHWNMNDARVRSWILDSVDPNICLSLHMHKTAQDMWKQLAATYSTASAARQFEVQIALDKLEQGDRDITAYLTAAQELWTEEDLLTLSLRPAATSVVLIEERKHARLLHFPMRLRPEFEPIRSAIIHRGALSMDGVVGDLIREETRLRTQAKLDLRPGDSESPLVAAAGDDAAFAVGRPQFHRRIPIAELHCHHCKEKGHLQKYCRKRNLCVYCKKGGHIILDCRLFVKHHGKHAEMSDNPQEQPRSDTRRTDRPAYSAQLAEGSGAGFSAAKIEELVNAALQKSLPTAINSAFAAMQVTGKKPSPWLLDSACYNHMTQNSDVLTSIQLVRHMNLRVANGEHLAVQGMGCVKQPRINLPNTLHVPNLVPNLVYVGQLTDHGCSVTFAPSGCVVQDLKTGRQIGRGSKQGWLFQLEELISPSSSSSSPVSDNSRHVSSPLVSSFSSLPSESNNVWDLWHSRLGHPNSGRLLQMFRQSLLGKHNVSMLSKHNCTSCVEAKTISISSPSSSTVISEPFHIIHSDLWGPSFVLSRHGFRYFALFVDHATRFTWVYFLRLKSDLKAIAEEFLKMVQTQFNKPVKILRSDPGGEFSSNPLLALYRSLSTLCQKSCPGVSQQNGLVERKNRHVLDLTRALLIESQVPSRFWPEAVATAVRLINYQITPVLQNVSPFFALYSRHPDYSRLRVFGCLCFVLMPRKERTKLTPKTARCAFLGYSDIHKGYICYYPVLQHVRIAATVVFFENFRFFPSVESENHLFNPMSQLPSFDDDDTENDDGLPPPEEPPSPLPNMPPTPPGTTPASSSSLHLDSPDTSSSSTSHASMSHSSTATSAASAADGGSPPPSPPHDNPRLSLRVNKGQPPPRFNEYFAYGIDALVVPTSYKQAEGNPLWEAAMQTEIDAVHANKTWTVVDGPPPEVPVIGCRWLYALKMTPQGEIERHRARIVAQGYSQEQGIDFDENFAPVAKMATVRTLLVVASVRRWPLFQFDVKNAFLHGDLKEVVYLEKPPGYNVGSPGQVCLLHRSLYGLKQAPRAWFEKFQTTVQKLGMRQSLSDPSLFTQTTAAGIVVLLLYVDDMVVTGDDTHEITALKRGLQEAFHLKDLGNLSYFLGLEISRNDQGIHIGQRKYIGDLLSEHHFDDCQPVSTPMELNLKLRRDSGSSLPEGDSSCYRSLVGSLIYLAATRPDISYVVQMVSQFMAVPHRDHLAAAHRILRYLKGT
ncbi:unnamed protein product [Linum trigynum]|uniref:Integrase catalytic domain-containing protein n=1 Tax=Linum trigynum TaxID=586398 RepID=A0AAV2CIM5_9ROSI